MIFYIVFSGIIFALSILLTGVVLRWLRHRAILDAPNARSNHDTPTPRGGGIAVAATIAIAWIALLWLRPDLAIGLNPAVMLGALGLCLLSWLDDLRPLGAGLRLPAHLVACAIGIWALPDNGLVFQGLLPAWADAVLVVLIWAGFLNFYNFMDGIDGITGVETIGIAGGLALFAIVVSMEPASQSLPLAAPLAIAVVAAGFLVWNWPPAKLFMGDVGSVPLGYCLGWFLLFLAVKGNWAAAVILPAYYLTDAGLTLVIRAARGEKVWLAHKEHFYQQAVASRMNAGLSRRRAHCRISAVIACLNAALVALALLSLSHAIVALVVSVAMVGGVLWWMKR
ncbi:MAG: hypothetical protein CMM78_06430 [Rhodospirillaceae bacterium]|jgi:UDP-N-acetylmuramyl pentapeptide phosphotransferase/UDP-N-acetylglucosamine-1-phosphate transferase|uniref:MraY family glycosyltransferase n=1 Tax=Hwanghaeella sp. 1Z406 TaxID=3402811 RepID=UPI000C3A5BCF|nr:hypothetical protein [Rhodospirillales bacterium]MAX47828.1 hypothetical protein [Rhodospirillaceae bacterium]|tara:strand:- start:8496 stop:9512 length:1017 start_codon:yes stop_codon:yes gene_type:complete